MASMSLQAAYDQARQWLETNDLDRAIGLAEHILEHYPNNLEAYRILGEAYLANRQLDRAQGAFEHVLRSDPENIPAHVGMGITYERQGRLDNAMVEFEQALEIKPDMAELRSQLLRLYTEAWGSERPLRLSRAGLARLYAKGHMLPQAINEFRQVIADQPSRIDAMVALAETLWRDEQEEEAMALCREILAQRPESLKANLILGYLEMASGRPTGERYWQAAAQMDPYYGVARALFDTLPPSADTQPQIEEWDEEAWRRRRIEEQQEQVAATRPMEVMSPVVGNPSEHFQNSSWITTSPSKPSSAARSSVAGDDFLASLLALDVPARPPDLPPPPAAATEEEDLDLGMVPFSLDDLDGESNPPPRAATTRPLEEPAADEPGMSPFSLADLGLSDDEIASLDSLGTAPATPSEPPAPFFEPTTPPAEPPPARAEQPPPARIEQPPAPVDPIEDEPTMAPFSLADLGLSDDEIAGLDSLGGESGGQSASEPFSFQEPPRGRSAPPPPPLEPALPDDQVDFGDLPLDLQPFSFDELDLGGESGSKADIGGLPPALQPFSLEDTPAPPPQRPRMSGFSSEENFENVAEEEEDIIPDSRGYSWQQPAHKPQTGFLKPKREQVEAEGEEASIFAKMKQRRRDEPEIPPEPLAPVTLGDEEHLGLFSLDDISLRDDVDAAPPAATTRPAESAPAPQAREEPPAAPPPSQVSPPASPDIESLDDALSSGQVQPFSLADLGLSDEEIALLGMGDASTPLTSPDLAAPTLLPEVQPPAAAEPATSLDLNLDDQFDFDAPTSTAPSQPVPPAPQEEVDEGPALTSDLQPFSLADLGLSDDEIVALGLGPSTEPEDIGGSELGLTEEELEGLDLGDLSWGTPPPPAAPEPTPAEPSEPAAQVISGDLVVDSLIALGRQQGYVDISDIIAGVEDPEAEAARIEEIGRLLHEANIEIRDGDEVIDMDAEYAEEEYSEPAADWQATIPDVPAEGDMTPFSLSDLGLSEDEITSLGLGETAPTQASAPEPPTPPAEADMTPFSLSDLGLSEDEIAALGLGETAQPSAPEPPAVPDEPVMTPFSLSDLGLSDDEIASLGGTETPAETPPATPDEPAMTPFSLSDLGLSDDEITSLGGTEAPAEAPPVESAEPTEPAMTPFSLSDLGLSDEEIAALGLGETAQPSAPEPISTGTPAQPGVPEPPATPDEPVMTPFSLADLGLSDDEIAALGLGETAQPGVPEPPATPDEPVMTPFSLSDLGLSDDEITSLGGTETPAETPLAVPNEPVMTPFSLADLGLSDDEIASLEATETETSPGAVEEQAPVLPVARVDEPPQQPAPTEPPPDPTTRDSTVRRADTHTPPKSRVDQAPRQPTPTEPPAAPPTRETAERRADTREPARRQAEQPAPSAPARPAQGASTPMELTGNDELDTYIRMLETDPQNHVLRLSLARIGGQTGLPDLAVQQYKHLIKHSAMLDEIVDDLFDLIAYNDDRQVLRRLHRTLGDVYTKQGRLREAIQEYSWVG